MPTPPEKRRVEGGVSVLRGALSGAEAAVEGLDPVQELPEACMLWAQAPLHRQGTGPRKGQPGPDLEEFRLISCKLRKVVVFFSSNLCLRSGIFMTVMDTSL